jgi:enterochelin esterase family protein
MWGTAAGEIAIDDPRAPDVRRLLATHLAFARAPTPPEDAHALDVDALCDPAVTFFSFRRDGVLLAVGALKRLDAEHAEVKSMHTVAAARGQGIGRRMIDHLIAVARDEGYRRVSLETGSMAEFAPARDLYARVGFEVCAPFGDYRASPNSTYMTLRLCGTATFGPVPDTVRVDDPELAGDPDWFHEPGPPAGIEHLGVRVLGRAIAVGLWSPGEGELPLLLAHDGPEYDERAGLTRYAGAMIERGTVAPFRIALLPPGRRDEWYSASAAYGRSLCRRILPALREQVPVAGRPVGLGASLGALAMLQAQRAWPGTFAGLCLQSGTFFTPRFDRHESSFSRYGRVVRFVRAVLRAPGHEDPVPVAMTCGTEEENLQNNRMMASALAAQGYDVRLAEVPSGHDYPSWRDALDPHLTRLLARTWPPR